MRTIKFRAWHESDGIYGEMNYQKNSGVSDAIKFWNSIYADAPIMQFTGLKDRKGKEIYENDIISCWVSAAWDKEIPINIKGAIEFKNNGWWFSSNNNEHDGFYEYNGEVIGNIHENPELLK